MAFEGFSQAAIDFLWGISFNNERSWFEPHKQEYTDLVLNPLKELAHEVFDEIQDDFDHAMQLRVSRIYRDARRLHGRGPYKNHMWFVIHPPKEDRWSTAPAMYFEIAPNYYSYGMGYYQATPLTMAKYRTRMDKNPKRMEELVHSFNQQTVFKNSSERYARPKGESTELLAEWYNCKNFAVSCDRDPDDLLFSAELKTELVRGFRFLIPFFEYMNSLSGDPDPNV